MKLFALPRVSLRNSLLLVNALVAAALIGLSVQAWHAVKVQQLAQQRQIELAEAWHFSKQADMLYDALRADVLASLLIGQVTTSTRSRRANVFATTATLCTRPCTVCRKRHCRRNCAPRSSARSIRPSRMR